MSVNSVAENITHNNMVVGGLANIQLPNAIKVTSILPRTVTSNNLTLPLFSGPLLSSPLLAGSPQKNLLEQISHQLYQTLGLKNSALFNLRPNNELLTLQQFADLNLAPQISGTAFNNQIVKPNNWLNSAIISISNGIKDLPISLEPLLRSDSFRVTTLENGSIPITPQTYAHTNQLPMTMTTFFNDKGLSTKQHHFRTLEQGHTRQEYKQIKNKEASQHVPLFTPTISFIRDILAQVNAWLTKVFA